MSTSSNMVLIETKTVGSGGSASIDFTGIPQTGYTDLQIVIAARSTRVSPSDYPRIKFNGLTTNQSMRQLYGTGSGVGSTSESTIFGQMTAANATANTFGNTTFYIPNYTGSTYKSVSIDGVMENNATGSDSLIAAGLWSSTAAITDISFVSLNGANFVEGSTASLYGIKSASKVLTPKATGGIISTSGNYVIHTFTASGTFTPTANLTDVEYLVIAGGGGGGYVYMTGGGGAGGYRSSVTGESSGGGASAESKLSLTSGTPYTVTVGAGGAGSTASGTNGTSGSNSVFSTITSVGGGGGGDGAAGSTGGSGGGGGYVYTAGGSGTANQGYAGGAGSPNAYASVGGGGGGAGAIGGDGGTGSGIGKGGNGVSSNITGSAITRGGGGGGSANDGNTGGTGGTGGGGAGGTRIPGTNGVSGTTNSGGGGGAGIISGGSAGAGGSGIVIVRYAA